MKEIYFQENRENTGNEKQVVIYGLLLKYESLLYHFLNDQRLLTYRPIQHVFKLVFCAWLL